MGESGADCSPSGNNGGAENGPAVARDRTRGGERWRRRVTGVGLDLEEHGGGTLPDEARTASTVRAKFNPLRRRSPPPSVRRQHLPDPLNGAADESLSHHTDPKTCFRRSRNTHR